MDDDIQLPPQPRANLSWNQDQVERYARACYEAGLAAGRAEQAQPAKPEAHKVRIALGSNGGAWFPVGDDYIPITGEIVVTLCWTDGRAWIDSERNRELARRLRIYPSANYNTATAMSEAADALDGGER